MENWYTFEERTKDYEKMARWNTHAAYWFAKYGHRGQSRQGGDECRYFEHVREVALILIDEVHINDPELVQAGLLHDTLEDTGVFGNPTRLSREDWEQETNHRLTVNFGPRVARIVRNLTHLGSREEYYEQLRNSDSDTIIVKMCDTLHNLRTMGDLPRAKILRKTQEYKEKYFPIFFQLRNTEYEFPMTVLMHEMEQQISRLLA